MRYLALFALAAFVILGSTTSNAQDYTLDPAYGSIELTSGFEEDPHMVTVLAGGSVEVSPMTDGISQCHAGGYVSEAPDYDLLYTASDDFPLSIGAISEGDTDTMILINLPDGTWVCDDDSFGDLDPILTFSSPQSGLYSIWVGTIGPDLIEAELIITELPVNE